MKRNYGIDSLRLLLMLMVVTLHVLGSGGILRAEEPLSAIYCWAWLPESLAYCAVNCYAMITGFVHYDRKYRPSSLVLLWLQTMCYYLGIRIFVWILRPENFSLGALIDTFMPISKEAYWYLSSYAGLFILIPFLNAAIKGLTERQTKGLLVAFLAVFSFLPSISRVDAFDLDFGYSTIWLCLAYILGASIKKYNWFDHISPKKAIFTYLVLSLVSWGGKLGMIAVTRYFCVTENTLFNFVSYISPTIVFAALSLFVAFKNMHLGTTVSKIIRTLSPGAFGVYLIHMQPNMKSFFIAKRFVFLTEYPIPIMLLGVVASAVCIFTVCLCIDLIRNQVFKVLKIRLLLERIENKLLNHKQKTS